MQWRALNFVQPTTDYSIDSNAICSASETTLYLNATIFLYWYVVTIACICLITTHNCILDVEEDDDSSSEEIMNVFKHIPPNLLNPKGCYIMV